MEDEYLLEEEYDVSAYGKLWDEMYGMRKHVRKTRKELEKLYEKS